MLAVSVAYCSFKDGCHENLELKRPTICCKTLTERNPILISPSTSCQLYCTYVWDGVFKILHVPMPKLTTWSNMFICTQKTISILLHTSYTTNFQRALHTYWSEVPSNSSVR